MKNKGICKLFCRLFRAFVHFEPSGASAGQRIVPGKTVPGQTNRKAFELMVKAKIINKIPSCDPSRPPLGATANQKKFKSSLLDIGLLQRLCQLPVELELQHQDILVMFRGKPAEQFVAQELLALQDSSLFYWARDARGSNVEVDYLFVKNGKIYSIEVKSSKGGSLRSLHLMLEKYPDCPRGLVFYNEEHKILAEQKLEFLPLYSIASICRQEIIF